MTTKQANDAKVVKPNPRGTISLLSLLALAGSHLRRAVGATPKDGYGSEFDAQCHVLCFGPFSDWDHLQATCQDQSV